MKMTQSTAQMVYSERKSCLIKYCISSAILLISACAIAIIDPLERLIENQLEMRRGSFLFNLWENPPLDVYLKVYIFNITNGDAFLSGRDKKLKVEEVGPYVYQEFLVNHNATFNDNGTLSFVPKRKCVLLPERSVGDPEKDIVIVPNLVLLAASTAAAQANSFAAFGVSTLVKSLNARPLINLTVSDFMWGYDDNLVKLANNLVPNMITFERLGVLDRLFDEGSNVVTMILPDGVKKSNNERKLQEEAQKLKEIEKHVAELREIIKSTTSTSTTTTTTEKAPQAVISNKVSDVEYDDDFIEDTYEDDTDKFNEIPTMALKAPSNKYEIPEVRDFSIDRWNGSPGLKYWGYNESKNANNPPCSILRGTYDGTLFPKRFKKEDKFFVYRKAFCRKLAIHYAEQGKLNGIDVYWFKLADNAFDDKPDDPDTICYCNKEKTCPKRGLGNITPCYYNLPIAVSLPHFYNSDPTLLNEVEGLKPTKSLHESVIAMQPRLGVPIKVTSRIQLNLMNGETKFNTDVKKFDHMTLPVLWIEAAIEKLTPSLDIILNLAFNILPVVQKIIVYILAFIGCSLFAMSLLKFFLLCNLPSDTKKSIKYTAVFPYIKREIAKLEEKEREMLQRIDAV